MKEHAVHYEVPQELNELRDQDLGILAIDYDRDRISIFYDSAMPDDLLDVLKEGIWTNYEMNYYPAREEEGGIYLD